MGSSGTKQRFPREQAELVAGALIRLLEPTCERVQAAGSLRRGQETVGDIELVCIPRATRDMFDRPSSGHSLLDLKLQELIAIKGLIVRGAYGPKNKFLSHIPSGIPLDIFTTTPENWGMTLLVRTGPAPFNIRVMGRFRKLGMRGHAYGGVTRGGEEVPCPDEETVFRLLGWEFIPPEGRKGGSA